MAKGQSGKDGTKPVSRALSRPQAEMLEINKAWAQKPPADPPADPPPVKKS